MVVVYRPIRIGATIAVLVFIYFTSQRLWHDLDGTPSIHPPNDLTTTIDQHAVEGVIGWPAHPQNPSEQPIEAGDRSETEAGLVQDAHSLPTADSFLSHFDAVTSLPGITMAEAKSGCTWPVMGQIYFQYTEDSDWVLQDRSDTELEMRRNQWHDFIKNDLIPYEPHKDKFSGRGIVIVAGNERSLKRVKAILRALKKLGSEIAIELHYWDDEMTPSQQAEISSMWPHGIYFNDLSSPSPQNILQTSHDSFLVNYQLKPAAILNSRFTELLLLDADNIPVIDPSLLFNSQTYAEYGTVFWPDIARTRPQNPIYPITNTRCLMDEYEQESGQMLVDKRRYFYHLQLAAWFINNPSQVEYYKDILLGDKDLFRFAWHALKTPFGKPHKWVTSVGTRAPDGPTSSYYCGHTFAQHHPDNTTASPSPPDSQSQSETQNLGGQIAFMHGGLIKRIPPFTMRWHRLSRGGIYQVYKRSPHDERPDAIVNVDIKYDDGHYVPGRPVGLDTAMCTDFFDVDARPLEEVVPGGFEDVWEEVGGYWMLDDP